MLSFLLGVGSGIVITFIIIAGSIYLGMHHFRAHPELIGQQIIRPMMKKAGEKRLKSVS